MLGKEEIVSPNLEELKSHYHSIITLLGEDAEREGLLKTPERVAKAMLSLTKGYHMDPHEVLRSAKFQEELKHMLYALQDPALAHDEEKCNALMIRYNDLRGIQSIMAKRLGDRVVLR
jgi:hypothetical protein